MVVVDDDEVPPTATSHVLAIQNGPPAPSTRVWNIDQHLLQGLYGGHQTWGPDHAMDPEPCFREKEFL